MYILNGTPQYSVLSQNKENILFKAIVSSLNYNFHYANINEVLKITFKNIICNVDVSFYDK